VLDRLYDVQRVANAKKSLLDKKGVDTSSRKAQQLIEFFMTNPNKNSVIVITYMQKTKGQAQKIREKHLR
jgi:hypothetical protein